MTKVSIAARVTYLIRRPLARRWVTYAPAVRLRGARADLLVRPGSAVCIEGYPRSGNTFAFASLKLANPDLGHVARHLHAPAQVERAVALGVPTCIIVRPVRDCVASLLVRGSGGAARQLVDDHVAFHEVVGRHLDGVVVVPFEALVADPGIVADALNERFDCGLDRFDDSPTAREEVERLVRRMDREDVDGAGETTVALPSADRESARQRALAWIEEQVPAVRLELADALVDQLTGHGA